MMQQFITQLRKEIFEQWASRKTPILLVVMLALGLLSPISAKVLPELLGMISAEQNITILIPDPSVKDALLQYVKNSSQLIMIVVLLLGTIAIVAERERGLMTLIFPHALSRTVFVLGKFAALALLLLFGVIVQAIACYAYTSLLFSAPDFAQYLSITALIYLYLLVFLSLALFASSIGQTTISAASLSFLFVVLIFILGIFVDYAPSKLMDYAGALAMGIRFDTPVSAFIASGLLIAASLVASCFVLERQEIYSATGS